MLLRVISRTSRKSIQFQLKLKYIDKSSLFKSLLLRGFGRWNRCNEKEERISDQTTWESSIQIRTNRYIYRSRCTGVYVGVVAMVQGVLVMLLLLGTNDRTSCPISSSQCTVFGPVVSGIVQSKSFSNKKEKDNLWGESNKILQAKNENYMYIINNNEC